MKEGGSDTFTWDHENRLVSATMGGVTTSYTYNPAAEPRAGSDGLRVSRSSCRYATMPS